MTDLPDLEPRTLNRFVPFLRTLSSHLNDVDQRLSASVNYMRDRRLREAYLLYYVTSNLLKLMWALKELWPVGPPVDRTNDIVAPLRILDIGCGPGTGIAALHAWLEHCPGARPLHVRGIDAVSANAALYREMGRLLREHSGQAIDCEADTGDARHLDGESEIYDLVMGMNVLNEIPEAAHQRLLERCAELLAPGGALLFIEPALKKTSRGLLRLRDLAVRDGWTVISPCFRQGACPALINEKDWCHHDMPWDRPAFIAWLDEEIGNIKRSLKFSCVVLKREASPLQGVTERENRLRVVSELFVEKGRSWCFCCGEGGRKVYQRNLRDRSEANAAFDELRRYDAITLDGMEEREHDIRIVPATKVQPLIKGWRQVGTDTWKD
jgi:ribosomal protein RSM22 (predicted rRNA methylase)